MNGIKFSSVARVCVVGCLLLASGCSVSTENVPKNGYNLLQDKQEVKLSLGEVHVPNQIRVPSPDSSFHSSNYLLRVPRDGRIQVNTLRLDARGCALEEVVVSYSLAWIEADGSIMIESITEGEGYAARSGINYDLSVLIDGLRSCSDVTLDFAVSIMPPADPTATPAPSPSPGGVPATGIQDAKYFHCRSAEWDVVVDFSRSGLPSGDLRSTPVSWTRASSATKGAYVVEYVSVFENGPATTYYLKDRYSDFDLNLTTWDYVTAEVEIVPVYGGPKNQVPCLGYRSL